MAYVELDGIRPSCWSLDNHRRRSTLCMQLRDGLTLTYALRVGSLR